MGVEMFTPGICLYVSVMIPLQSLNKVAGIGSRQVGVFPIGFLKGGGIITNWILLYTESSTSNCLSLNIYTGTYGWQLANT